MALQQVYDPWSSNIGVGTNEPTYPAGSTLPQPVAQVLGNAADWIGGKLGIPETGISEAIAGGPTTNTNQVQAADGFNPADYQQRGWNDMNAAYQDFLATGGPGKESMGASGGWTPTTYNNPYTNQAATTTEQSPNIPSKEEMLRGAYPTTDLGKFDLGADEFMNEINSQYGGRMDYLSKAEQAIRSGQPEILEALAADMRAGTSRAGTARGAELGTLQGAGQQATGRKEDALASARRLYSELRRGSQQRFGGASSAGEAMNTLLGVEQQKQMGQTRRDFGQTMATIDREKTKIESQYQDQLLQLEANNTRDKAQAQNEFRSRLDEINNNRLLASDAKYQARLGVLQDLRDKNFQIQAQQEQFKQQLEANRQQQAMDLDTYAQQLKMSSGAGQGASNAFSNQTTVNPRSDITAGGGPSSQPVDFNAKVLQGFTSDDELPFWMK